MLGTSVTVSAADVRSNPCGDANKFASLLFVYHSPQRLSDVVLLESRQAKRRLAQIGCDDGVAEHRIGGGR